MTLYQTYRHNLALQKRYEWAAENMSRPKNFRKQVYYARKSAMHGARAYRAWEALRISGETL